MNTTTSVTLPISEGVSFIGSPETAAQLSRQMRRATMEAAKRQSVAALNAYKWDRTPENWERYRQAYFQAWGTYPQEEA